MAYDQSEQGTQATFFIRISSNPIIREEFCASENGVIFVKATESRNARTRLKALFDVVRLSLRLTKQDPPRRVPQAHEAPSTSSERGRNALNQNPGQVSELIKFLLFEKAQAQWIQRILSRQNENLEEPVFTSSYPGELIPINPAHALSVKRTKRNLLEMSDRKKRLQRAIELLDGTIEEPDSLYLLNVIKFLRCQAADMKYGTEVAQRKIEELSKTTGNEEVSEHDPYTKALVQKAEWKSREEQYLQVSTMLSDIVEEFCASNSSSPLAFWNRI